MYILETLCNGKSEISVGFPEDENDWTNLIDRIVFHIEDGNVTVIDSSGGEHQTRVDGLDAEHDRVTGEELLTFHFLLGTDALRPGFSPPPYSQAHVDMVSITTADIDAFMDRADEVPAERNIRIFPNVGVALRLLGTERRVKKVGRLQDGQFAVEFPTDCEMYPYVDEDEPDSLKSAILRYWPDTKI